ncbi:Protein CELLULOSE SYNTHASE INTERACTIVE 1 [Camellia lanceoleosa]|uniref:Protein CELLULOSE SYNTHASE INTERACTIVE 1 n=1 Tax=Camellia lanceoleosa TaxID=1840588 RepID=A0ACC0IGA3_9ERIC|nr:Protein CELLULOSE SYNTHASE INTERACTIVE 1 [Camellia lanceoleosa]
MVIAYTTIMPDQICQVLCKPPLLVVLANSSVLQVAEQATCALANLLLDNEVSEKAIPEEIILPATRVLREGTVDGKTHAAAAIAWLLHSRRIDSALTDCVNHAGTFLALVAFLESAHNGSAAMSKALDALAFLSRSEGASEHIKPAWAVLAEFPNSITPIVLCIADASALLQDKAIEILSRLCWAQPVVLGAFASGCISSIARRVIAASNQRVKFGGNCTSYLCCKNKSPESCG